jgi:hypothetical protein
MPALAGGNRGTRRTHGELRGECRKRPLSRSAGTFPTPCRSIQVYRAPAAVASPHTAELLCWGLLDWSPFFSTTHKKQPLGSQFFAHDAEIANAATTIAAPTVTGCGMALPCDQNSAWRKTTFLGGGKTYSNPVDCVHAPRFFLGYCAAILVNGPGEASFQIALGLFKMDQLATKRVHVSRTFPRGLGQ